MSKFIDSLCITNAQFQMGEKNKKLVSFEIKTMFDNQERVMVFGFLLKPNSNGEMVPDNVIALGENKLIEVSNEEYQFRMNLKTYRNELFERLKKEKKIRLHALFL